MKDLHIAYVDDEKTYIWLLENDIEEYNQNPDRRFNITMTGFDDPDKFLDAYKDSPKQFDLVLLDIFLDRKRGFDLLDDIWIQEKPVIMTSNAINSNHKYKSMMPKFATRITDIIERYLYLLRNHFQNMSQLNLCSQNKLYGIARG